VAGAGGSGRGRSALAVSGSPGVGAGAPSGSAGGAGTLRPGAGGAGRSWRNARGTGPARPGARAVGTCRSRFGGGVLLRIGFLRGLFRAGRTQRQVDGHGGTTAGGGTVADRAAVRTHDGGHDRQAEAGSAGGAGAGGVRAVEPLEDPVGGFGWNTRAVVAHLECGPTGRG